MQHDKIKDELGDLLSQPLSPPAIRDKSSIKPSQIVRNKEPKDQKNDNSEDVVD